MKRSTLILLPALLAGCSVHSNSKDDGDANGKVAINADGSGNIAFDVPFAKGQVKVPAGMMHSGDVDIDGVKLMPGSKLSGFNVDAHDKGANVDMSFTAPATPDEVRDYYLAKFKEKGIPASRTGDGVSGTSKDGDAFVIHVGPAPSGSAGKIEIVSKN